MTESILAIGVTATCVDGSVHDDVIMKLANGVVIYATPDGEHLCGDCRVNLIDNAQFLMPPQMIAQAIYKYQEQEKR